MRVIFVAFVVTIFVFLNVFWMMEGHRQRPDCLINTETAVKICRHWAEHTEPLLVPALYQPRCHLRIHIYHTIHYLTLTLTLNLSLTLNLTLTWSYLTNNLRYAQHGVSGYWITSRLCDQSGAQCKWLCMHWVHSSSVPRVLIFCYVMVCSTVLRAVLPVVCRISLHCVHQTITTVVYFIAISKASLFKLEIQQVLYFCLRKFW